MTDREIRGRIRRVNVGTVDVHAGGNIFNCRVAHPLSTNDLQVGDIVGMFWVFDTPNVFCLLGRSSNEIESETASTTTTTTTTSTSSDYVDTNTWKQYATIVVAANDSTAEGKASADYVCNGSSDHLTLQNALAASPSSGKQKILLLEGTYHLSGQINVPDNTWIQGQGMGVSVLRWYGYSGVTPVLFYTAGDNIALSDFSVDHKYTDSPVTTAGCRTIQANNDRLTVRNILDQDNDDGVFLYADNFDGNLEVDRVLMTSPSGTGAPEYSVQIAQNNSDPEFATVCENIRITNCEFGNAPIKMVGGATPVILLEDVLVTGVTISGCSLQANGMALEQVMDLSLMGNTVTGDSTGASISGVIGLACSGNTFKGDGDGLYINAPYNLDTVGIQNVAISIVANTFRTVGDAIVLEGPNYGASEWPGDHGDQNAHTVISGNQFYSETFLSSRAVNLNGAADVILGNNEFNNYETPIDIDGKRISVKDNHFVGCGYNVRLTGSCRDIDVIGSTFFNCQYEAILVDGGLVGGNIKSNYFLHGSQDDGTDPWIHTATGAVVSDLTIEGNKFRSGRSTTQATYCLQLNASETVWNDTFTDDDDTDILDHDPNTGTAYAYIGSGTFDIQSNKLSSGTLPNGYCFVVADRGIAPTEINVKWQAGTQQQFALIRVCFRVGGLKDYWYVFLQPYTDRIRLRKLVDDVWTEEASYSTTLSHSTEYALKIELTGNDIDIYHAGGGSPCISITDSTHVQYTGVGLYSNTFNDTFDDFSLKAGNFGTTIKDNDFRDGAAADMSIGADVDVLYFGENLMSDGTIYDQEATRRETMAFLGA